MGACISKQSRPRQNACVEEENNHAEIRQGSSLLDRDLEVEEKVQYMTRHHKKGLFDIPYRLRARGVFPNLSQTTKDIIAASKDDAGSKMKKGKVEKGKVEKAWVEEDWIKDVSQRYELISTLGMGGTSTVWLAKDRKTGEEVAIKVFKRPIGKDEVPLLYNELLVGSQSWFYDTVSTGAMPPDSIFLCHTRSAFLTRHCYGVVMEVAWGGNIAEYVSATCGKHVTPTGERCHLAIDEEQARFIFRQILQGLGHMHTNMQTAHRDIKLDNTVIHQSWTEAKSIGTVDHCVGRVEFVDFQYAYHYGQNSPMIQCKNLMGTPVYMSPELLALRFNPTCHTYDPITSDIWAIGIILVAMLFGTFPFDDAAPKTMEGLERSIYYIQKRHTWKEARGIAPFLKFASSECIDLLDSILQVNPSKRSSLSQIEMHPWIRKPFASKALESGWKSIQREVQEQSELPPPFVIEDDSSRARIVSIVQARNKAAKRLIHIASQPYDDELDSIIDQDEEAFQCPISQDDEWREFHAPEIAGLIDHHSFSDERSVEISMGMSDIYMIVGSNRS